MRCTQSACTGRFAAASPDRKSTRLNSSHSQISYAVFCLKKKKKFRLVVGRAKIKASEERALLPLDSLCLLSRAADPAFFFFNDTATTEIYTLSLHDALPIQVRRRVA